MMSALSVLDPEVTFTHVALLIAFMTGIAVGIAVFMQFRSDTSSEVRNLRREIKALREIGKIEKENLSVDRMRQSANLRAAAEDAANLAEFLTTLANPDDPDDSDDETY